MIPFFKINRNYKNFTRLIKIISIIGKYGFSAFLGRIRAGLGPLPERFIKIKQEKSLVMLTEPQRLRLAIEELGPAFIKMGQIMSLRPDIIPPAYAEELEKLQDKTVPADFTEIREIIENETGETIDDIFSEIDPVPVASGSIAQVHRAVLKKGGDRVAVKVLKPKTREIVEADLSIIKLFTRLAAHYIPELQAYNPLETIQEFSEILLNELNFLKEAGTIKRFSRFFRDEKSVHIPLVYTEYTTGGVLVMEFIDGIKVTDIEKLDESGLDRKEIAKNSAQISLRALFEFGFYHADPHPGNIFILPGNVVAPVDFGITGYIDDEGLKILGNMIIGLMDRDPDRIIHYFKRYNFIEDDVDIRKLKIDLYYLMDLTQEAQLSSIDVSTSIQTIFSITRKYRVRFPSEYFLVFKTLLEVEGVGKKLYPEFDVTKSARPYIKQWSFDQYSPKRFIKEILLVLDDLNYIIKSLPMELGSIIKKIRFGKLKLPILHENLEKAVAEIDRIGNRLSFSIIIAALLLSSSMIVQAKIGPFIRGYPVLGLAGFFTAAIMGIWLLIGIIKSGRL
ncbi:MAG TPA: AarF/ABC1/UbiB kinase family protein [Spirochaetes bacterium]|nr:AarF/ABC1/UbiB kinase family protein [Spirochaetota bacterium]